VDFRCVAYKSVAGRDRRGAELGGEKHGHSAATLMKKEGALGKTKKSEGRPSKGSAKLAFSGESVGDQLMSRESLQVLKAAREKTGGGIRCSYPPLRLLWRVLRGDGN